MKIRIALAATLAVLGVVPMGTAQAEHCPIPVYLFSNFRVQTDVDDPRNGDKLQPGNSTVVSSAVGCTVIETDDPNIPGDESNTDYIYPGSNNFGVRYLLVDHALGQSTLEFAGETYDLTFKQGYDQTGTTRNATFMDSNRIFFDPALSINGGEAKVTVCLTDEDETCYTRVYRTLG